MITDPVGAVVPRAKIIIRHADTGVTTPSATNEAGIFQSSGLSIGRYEVRVEAGGFKAFVKSGVLLETGQTVRVDAMLEVGATQDSVTVTAESPLLEQETSSAGTQVTGEMLSRLPYQMGGSLRNPTTFIRLTPGASGTSGSAGNAVMSGGRTFASEMLVDGIPVTYNASQSVGDASTPAFDTIAEFRVEAVVPPAEYGRTSGGVILMSSRAGANQYRGNLIALFRNGKFDARRYNARTADGLRQAEFGASIGGPVSIPKLYDGHNRTFFFFNYSGFRRATSAQASVGTVPTEAMRAGDFSGRTERIFDPLTAGADGTRQQFPTNQIPAARISSFAKTMQAVVPLPNAPGFASNYAGSTDTTEDDDSYFLRFDHSLSDKHRLSGSYRPQKRTRSGTVGPLTRELHGYMDSPITKNVTLSDDLILSPALFTRVQAGMSWFTNPRWESLGNIGLGVPGAYTAGLPGVAFSGQGLTAWANDNDRAPVNYSWYLQPAVSWTKGTHNLKFGGRIDRYRTNNNSVINEEGTYTFSQFGTSQPRVNGTGHSYASYLLGLVNNATLQKSLGEVSDSAYFAAFLQDDWKVTRRLTINWGLRWEAQLPWWEPRGQTSIMDPTLPNPGAGGRPGAIVFAGDGAGRSGGKRFMQTYLTAVGPRLGMAYQLTPRTVLRAGYGMFYAGLVGQDLNRAGFSGNTSISSQDGGLTPVFQIDRGWPAGLVKAPPFIDPTVANGSSASMIEGQRGGSGRLPRTSQWQFSVQRTVRDVLVEATYAGTVGHGITTGALNAQNQLHPDFLKLGTLLTRNINDAAVQAAGYRAPYAGFNGTLAQSLRAFPQYQNVTILDAPQGNSSYHALYLKSEKRFSHGLQFLVAYAFSKTISDVSISRDDYVKPQDQYNRRAEKSIANLDVSNRLTTSFTYELPAGKGKRWLKDGPVAQVLGGWSVSGIITLQAGSALRINVPNGLPIFNGYLRPNRVNNVPMGISPGRGNFEPLNTLTGQQGDLYLDRAAFEAPAPYTLGNLGVFLPDVRGPGTINEDFALAKSFRVTEKRRIEFRADLFNAFNRRNLNDPSTDLTSASFGRITGQKAARVAQFGFRFDF